MSTTDLLSIQYLQGALVFLLIITNAPLASPKSGGDAPNMNFFLCKQALR